MSGSCEYKVLSTKLLASALSLRCLSRSEPVVCVWFHLEMKLVLQTSLISLNDASIWLRRV